ncbi:carbohydrate ABC transporter permease [Pleomorphomonas sp. PLEO]|uniref:carbohydrate ABC transporter permease n=1 Tax=Pleomorphomonas sp. PLEO TaxID=3239306 RepID=UPI00351F2BD9
MNPLSHSLSSRAQAILAHAVIWAAVAFAALPFAWMVLTSLRDPSEIFDTSRLFVPQHFAVAANYGQALSGTPLIRFMANGAIVCGLILFAQIVTALPCAYAIAKLPFRHKSSLLALVVLGLLVPFQATALPMFLGLAWMNALDSYFALVAPFLVSPFAILLFSQFLRAFPNEVIEAARLDRCSHATILLRIILPAAMPAIAAFAVFSVTFHWNDLYWPMIAISSTDLAPPTLGILFFRGADGGDSYGALMAAATLITLPLVIVFMLAQKRFVEGITMGAVK